MYKATDNNYSNAYDPERPETMATIKTPITYYGGKQRLSEWIISFFPPHKTYVEPFAGGLSVFFKKEASPVEVISDTNKNIYNFYKNLRDSPKKLKKLIENTPFSENDFKEITDIMKGKIKASSLERARATFCGFSMARWGCDPVTSPGFKYSMVRNPAVAFQNKIKDMDVFHKRIQNAQILNKDAQRILTIYNQKNTLFYLDPPYPGTLQKYANQFSQKQWNNLIRTLKDTKAKFLLSFYFRSWMKFPKKWHMEKRNIPLLPRKTRDRRTECLIMNFPPPQRTLPLF